MAELPLEFQCAMRRLLGDERYERYLLSFDEEAPVSIRLNPRKAKGLAPEGERVPWCEEGYYLPARPNFTFDPLFHAGCYYVQEASSMFLHRALRQYLPDRPVAMLDLCAAPGGKSTLARTLLPEGSVLYANEPVRQRASVLAENVWKWGYEDCHVTNAYPRDYRRARLTFDVVLCDVPCSGEGMFRKDRATIGEWSPQGVERCWRLQREIVDDAWACLADGGLLIYSTCTFNTKENEENIRYILETRDARVLPVATEAQWHITGSLLDGFEEPVYRFIPGITRGEGLFLCVLQKAPSSEIMPIVVEDNSHRYQSYLPSLSKTSPIVIKDISHRCPRHLPSLSEIKPIVTTELPADAPRVEVSYVQAIAYLRHEALVLPPDVPRGLVAITFGGHTLGAAKNIGNRANNLYPKEWKIKTTHTLQDYEAILRPTEPHTD